MEAEDGVIHPQGLPGNHRKPGGRPGMGSADEAAEGIDPAPPRFQASCLPHCESVSVTAGPPVCGHLLQQPQETVQRPPSSGRQEEKGLVCPPTLVLLHRAWRLGDSS